MEINKQELLDYIVEDLHDGEETVAFDTSLFKSRMLDSISLTDLISYVEEEFEIKVKPMEVVFENFDSVDNLAAFIQKKKS